MCAVCADDELELKQQLVRRHVPGIVRPPELPSDLTELARPVRQNHRLRRVAARRLLRATGSIEAKARKPPPTELVVTRNVESRRVLQPARLIPAAPHDLRSAHERVVDRTLQRTPTQGGIDPEQVRGVPPQVEIVDDTCGVMAVREGGSKVDVRRLGDIAIRAEMPDVAEIASSRGTKQLP